MGCTHSEKQTESVRKGSTADGSHDPFSTAAATTDKGEPAATFVHASDIVGTTFKEAGTG